MADAAIRRCECSTDRSISVKLGQVLRDAIPDTVAIHIKLGNPMKPVIARHMTFVGQIHKLPRRAKFEEEEMSKNIEARVKEIVAEHLDVEEAKVNADASFIDDLGADSLDTVELVMALEEEFECEIPDEEAEKITTVQQAVDDSPTGRVVIEMANVKQFTSGPLGALVVCARKADEKGGQLVLAASVSGFVGKVLSTATETKKSPSFPNVRAALASLSTDAASAFDKKK